MRQRIDNRCAVFDLLDNVGASDDDIMRILAEVDGMFGDARIFATAKTSLDGTERIFVGTMPLEDGASEVWREYLVSVQRNEQNTP